MNSLVKAVVKATSAVLFCVGLDAGAAMAIELRLPARCLLGQDCFIQQYVDTDPGPDAKDPFCGGATYDGHDGLDLRVLSMQDVLRGVAVVAVADGEVLRDRDGQPDHLVMTADDSAAVAGKECGNGVVVKHADGYETQYCHLRQGSLVVEPGQMVKAGDKLGEIGASGMAQFPHVHLTVRKDGKVIDPIMGRPPSEGCLASRTMVHTLFSPDVVGRMSQGKPDILAIGLSGAPVDYARLVLDGPPLTAIRGDGVTVAWGWFTNLQAGDQIRFKIVAPEGSVLVDNTTEPVDRNKAVFSAFAGKRRSPQAGSYGITVTILRGGQAIAEKSDTITVN